ncbi:MAG: Ppx/GppA family phosphatase [Chlorobi bacterium]|nr:Ppx/GppA family phosphatase [Chlorobiota bacterium]
MINNGKIAAIDVGTNSFHLIVVEPRENGSFEIVDQAREVVRLGEGNKGDIKKIKAAPFERGVNTLKNFKGIADSHNAAIRAIATSAVREAENRAEFVAEVKESSGIEIEIVNGIEEARLIYLGVSKAIHLKNKTAFCFDIGGGSTEFIFGRKEIILYSMSLKLGAVRLTQMFFPDGTVTEQNVKHCADWIEGILQPVVRESGHIIFDEAVASSGTGLAAASMIYMKRKQTEAFKVNLNNFVLSASELFDLREELLAMKTTSERKKILGQEAKRADIIPAGIILLTEIVKHFGIKKLKVSSYALREGIVLDTMNKFGLFGDGERNRNIREAGVKALSEKCNYDRKHCFHTAVLAEQLFYHLKSLHGLSDKYLSYLIYAAQLHDIGYHISHSRHHLHSLYIIKNSELLGFNETEKLLIANIARYHRKSAPKLSHQDFTALPEGKQLAVKKLAAILRIADSFDRTHTQKVKNLGVKIEEQNILIIPQIENADLSIELWNVERRKSMFEEVFGKKLKVVVEV